MSVHAIDLKNYLACYVTKEDQKVYIKLYNNELVPVFVVKKDIDGDIILEI